MKTIIVIGDGMADNPVPALQGKTPLEAADIPHMDALARAGRCGSVKTVPDGVTPGSDTAILSIFGYDPRVSYSGRSPLEAAGAGVQLAAGDVSYRCNMVALEDTPLPYEQKKILSHSGGSVDGESALALMEALLADPAFAACAKKHGMRFYPSPSFRHIAVQTGVDINGLIAAPPHDHLGESVGANLPLPQNSPTAQGLREMMAIAHRVLDVHPLNQKRRSEGQLPANGIWFWAEGTAIELPQLTDKYGIKGIVVSAVPLVRGIGKLAGLDYALVDGATGELDTNYEGKAAAVLDGLQNGYDFAVLHIEAPDECTHNGDTPGKLQAIEWVDSRAVAPLLEGLRAMGEPFRLLLLSDHKTLTSNRGHDADPVPFVLYDSQQRQPGAAAYTEAECGKGEYVSEGHTLIGQLFGAG